MNGWFVVRTKPNAEERAVWHLKNQGFDVYLPRYRKQVRHARKSQTVLRALFPGYVFVYMDPERQRWRSVNGTVGVVSLVQFGDKPHPISGVVVEDLRAREENGVVSLASQNLQTGDQVRVCEGAFEDHMALLAEVCDQKRVILLLELMGRKVRVNVETGHLEKVS